MPAADFRLPMGRPCGAPSPCGASGGSPGVISCCFPRVTVGSTRCAWQLEDFGLCCTLVPRISPRIRFPVRSARVFASGFLSAPLAGIQLPSATLWRHLPGAGLTRLISSSVPVACSGFPLTGLTGLVCSRACTRKQPGVPGTQPSARGYGSQARRTSTLTLASEMKKWFTLSALCIAITAACYFGYKMEQRQALFYWACMTGERSSWNHEATLRWTALSPDGDGADEIVKNFHFIPHWIVYDPADVHDIERTSSTRREKELRLACLLPRFTLSEIHRQPPPPLCEMREMPTSASTTTNQPALRTD